MILPRVLARRCAAYLALAALALQLAASFAHVHRHDLAVPVMDGTDVVSAAHARPGPQVAERLPARLADQDECCPICFSGFLLSSSSLPDAPAGAHSLQFAEIDRSSGPVSDRVLQPRHAAFSSRAPPAA